MTDQKDQQSEVTNDNVDVQNEQIPEQQMDRNVEEIQSKEVVSNISNDAVQFHFAGFWMRFWAYIVDLIVISSINRMIVKPLFAALDVSPYSGIAIFSPYNIGYAVVFFLYFVLMTKFFKQTLGKMVFGLKVVSLKQDSLTWSTIVFREFIGRFISKTVWITYALVGILPKKQGLHDLFADTTVVLENKR
ncbi:RDD family protein [Bacillus massiliigorillae]|uniref:RDD family protein n=1 Tax=Bacillus massiliigorillae TaxID=1243664 RepID=UPI00039D49C6|nr:RDD family protein [Bacillus massiliigorillae]